MINKLSENIIVEYSWDNWFGTISPYIMRNKDIDKFIHCDATNRLISDIRRRQNELARLVWFMLRT